MVRLPRDVHLRVSSGTEDTSTNAIVVLRNMRKSTKQARWASPADAKQALPRSAPHTLGHCLAPPDQKTKSRGTMSYACET